MYGFCILAGILLASLLGEKLCKKQKLDTQVFWKAVFYGLLLGLLGARLYHVLDQIDYFIKQPAEILQIWRGGLGIWGGIIGGFLGVFLSVRKSPLWKNYLDVFAVCAPLAQAVGRWGNFFNREIFGPPTNLPWGIFIPLPNRPLQYRFYDHFHPLFLYESILNFILFLVLYRLFKTRRLFNRAVSSGTFALLYLAGYSLIRFFLEFLKISPWSLFGFPIASILSMGVFLTSIIVMKTYAN